MRFKLERSSKTRKRLKGLLRVSAYFAALGVVSGGFALRAAHAEVGDRTLEIGRQMAALADATHQDLNHLRINGQTMWMASSLTNDPAKAVLDRYASYCASKAAQTPESWREVVSKTDESSPARGLFDGVLRGGDEREGSILCFTKNARSKPTAREAFQSLAETGQLDAIGNLRYAYVRTSEHGTVVLTAWTDDVFNLRDLLTSDGEHDVPGTDFSEVPRMEGSTRVLSARVEGTPFGVNVYKGKEPPSAVLAFYDQHYTKDESPKWVAVDPELAKQGEKDPVLGRSYENEGVVVTIASRPQPSGTFTTIGVAGTRAPRRSLVDDMTSDANATNANTTNATPGR